MGIERSADGLIIQLALNEGRTVEVEKAFYKAVGATDCTSASASVKCEDVTIALVEVKKKKWFFGNDIAQYAS
jgi:4-oxalocrotonate tautomerase